MPLNKNTTAVLVAIITLIGTSIVAYFQYSNENGKNATNEHENNPIQYAVSGMVFDKMGNGITSAKVTIIGRIESDITSSGGRFNIVLRNFAGEYVKIHVEADGFIPDTEDRPVNQPLQIRLDKK